MQWIQKCSYSSRWLPFASVCIFVLAFGKKVNADALLRSETQYHSDRRIPWDYFDTLRSAQNISARTFAGSNVVEIRTNGRSYRLCHLAAFLALSDGTSVRADAHDKIATLLMAIHHFNNRIDSVVPQLNVHSNPTIRNCNVMLTTDIYDTRYSPIFASSQLVERVLQKTGSKSSPLPISLVGAYRSAVSSPLSKISGSNDIMQVSYFSTSTEFENKDEHGLFGRVVSSVEGDARALVGYMTEVLNASHLGIIYVKEAYGSSYQRAIQRAAKAGKVDLRTSSVSINFDQGNKGVSKNEVKRAITQLKRLGYRYFFGIVFEIHYDMIMEEAYEQGIAGDDFLWLFGDAIDLQVFQQAARYRHGSPLAHVTHGVGFLQFTSGVPDLDERPGYDRFLTEWSNLPYGDIENYVEDKQPDLTGLLNHRPMSNFSRSPSPVAVFLYDIVISLGLAACGSNATGFDGIELFSAFTQTEFNGATGDIRFDFKSGTRDYRTVLYTISNAIATEPDEAGMVSFSLEKTAMYASDGWISSGRPFNYTDKSFQPPSDLPPIGEDRNYIGKTVLVVGLTLSTTVMLLSLACAAWVFLNRTAKVVRVSQPEFLIMLCVGTFVMSSSVIPASMHEPVNPHALNAACMAIPWLLSSGFVISFSALLAKTWRINKIFGARRFRRVKITVVDALIPFFALMGTNSIILTTWTVVAPLKWHRVTSLTIDEFGRSIESYGSCQAKGNKSMAPFSISIAIVNLGCLVYANYECVKARKVQTEYSESRYIAGSMAFILQAVFLGIPVFAVVMDQPSARFLTYSAIVTIVCAGILLPLFPPKIRAVRRKDTTLSRRFCTVSSVCRISNEEEIIEKELGCFPALRRQSGSRRDSCSSNGDAYTATTRGSSATRLVDEIILGGGLENEGTLLARQLEAEERRTSALLLLNETLSKDLREAHQESLEGRSFVSEASSKTWRVRFKDDYDVSDHAF